MLSDLIDVSVLAAIANDPEAEWMSWGLCTEIDPDLWHPDAGGNPRPAKQICRQCPVREECLAYALEHDEMGVWGATTEKERRRMLTTAA